MSGLTLIILLTLPVLLATSTADAAFTSGKCLAQKRQAWGKLRQCQATEQAKALQGKTPDVAKCETTFQSKLAKLSLKASKAATVCRYLDNGDGTVTDCDTGLQWEKKTSPGGGPTDPHDVDNSYQWSISISGTAPDGAAFTDFLGRLNNCSFAPGIVFSLPGFAFHCDWRLPTLAELQGILLEPFPCGTNPCIDPIFGPTRPFGFYWTVTTRATDSTDAWLVLFFNDGISDAQTGNKSFPASVRAVRDAF